MLKAFASYITYILIKFDHDTNISGAAILIIYDTIKIFLLHTISILFISLIMSYFPPKKIKRILSHKKDFIGNTLTVLIKEEA